MRWMRVAGALLLLGVLNVWGGPADAACHSFMVELSPTTVNEGSKITVTVSRDGAVQPSQVRVSTIDGSAKAPSDYQAVNELVTFTTETSKTLSIQTNNDTTTENNESFRVHLSEPSGCPANMNYALEDDAFVQIRANDQKTPTPKPSLTPDATQDDDDDDPTPKPTETAEASPSPTASASPSPSPTALETFTPVPTLTPLSEDDGGDGGLPAGAIAGIILGAVAIGSGAYLLWFRARGV